MREVVDADEVITRLVRGSCEVGKKMEKPKKILCRQDKNYGKIFICPHCHRFVTLTMNGGIRQCYVCGGLVDTDSAELDLNGVRVKSDGLQSWR